MGPPPTPRLGTDGPAPEALVALVAREAEVEAIVGLLDGHESAPAALILEGAPGIGKTTLWERGVALGHERGLRVLSARASGAETELPFAALIDLLDGVTADDLAAVPSPRLQALNVALYREDPSDHPPEPHAISLGLLSALRLLAGREPLLVAIDDIQWLDRGSEEALAYAARRLGGEAVRFLLARRPGPRSALEATFTGDHLRRVDVAPISLGATRQVLAARLGLRLPHHLLRRVYDTTLGNPLFALEVGRVLARHDLETVGEEVLVPDHVEDLLGLRVTDLDEPVRRVLLALALDADLRVTPLTTLAGAESISSALDEGVVVLDGERVRPSHPLLAAAANRHATADQKRDVHRGLARIVASDESRALHLALATVGEDEDLASTASTAARRAATRGATRLAVELGTHAVRLTGPGSPAYVARVLDLGVHLGVAGEKERLTELLGSRAESLPRAADRVAAFLLLAKGVVRDNEHIRQLMERALEEAGDDTGLRAPVLAELAENEAAIIIEEVPRAARRAEEAAAADVLDPGDERLVLSALAWTRALTGHPVMDLAERYHSLPEDRYFLSRSPRRVAGQRLVWRGEIPPARDLFTSLKALSEERAEPSSYALVRLHLCELALRVGNWPDARRLLDDWAASDDSKLLHWPMFERCEALLAAGVGDSSQARRWAQTTLDRAEAIGTRWDWLEARRALGLAALLDKDLAGATKHLSAVWDHTQAQGVGDPGVFPAAPDLVESLVEAGSADEGRRVTDRLAELAEAQDHPWALVGARRSRAIVDLAESSYDDESARALEASATAYADLGLLFDEARTLLALGRAQRRARKWGAARDTLEKTAAAFDSIGSHGWAEDARSELARVGARRPTTPGRLTPTEQRVARLAAEGLSNKEIARTLVVTVNTVEFHLRNAYTKLGIRSRAQLASRLPDEGADLGQINRDS